MSKRIILKGCGELNLNPTWMDVPRASGGAVGDAYITLLVLLCIFVGAMLVLLSVLLVSCRRCYRGGRRYSRASNDPEKTNTTYLEESQPVPEITIQVDESDQLSTCSDRDTETERFLSTGSTGRRVSFNESALLDHGKKTQERGRRYTLTEGDFHHLKNARLTHLHLPAPTVSILTIQEYNAAADSSPKTSLSIFQPSVCPLPQTTLARLSPSSALPGDMLNSMVHPTPTIGPPRSCTIEVMGHRTWNGSTSEAGGDESSEAGLTAPTSQGSVLQFFTKLRRHASLEGPSPYFKIKKWKFDSSQRASSLDTRGSPKRHQFQRQRAASESTQQQEGEEPEQMELSITRPHDDAYHHGLLSPPPTPPPLPRQEEGEEDEEEELGVGAGPALGAVFRQDSAEHQALYRDIWTLRASLERNASSDQSSNNDRDSDIGDEGEPEDGGRDEERGGDGDSGNRKLLQMDSGYASIEAPPRAPETRGGGVGGGAGGGARGKTASEKRHFFTSAGREGSVCMSLEARLFQEELEDQAAVAGEEEEEKEEQEDGSAAGWPPYGQAFPVATKEAKLHPQALRRRDYSIDEKTDALFNEFLRHDPRFDQQESPARPRHRSSRVHLRKQWQRAKQNSDPGVRATTAHRGPPMRRGRQRQLPRWTRVTTATSRASSVQPTRRPARRPRRRGRSLEWAGPVKAGPVATRPGWSPARTGIGRRTIGGGAGEGVAEAESRQDRASAADTIRAESREGGAGAVETEEDRSKTATDELVDKLARGLEDRLYTGLRRPVGGGERVVKFAHTSPNHSPV
ncbi:hypothetical protein SKAU_G00205290 [Synaphobranchus kaupii]|uniref:Voltage-dependent calcium channel beta subunit-associated regulatory protein n=1 Tax=Synaphobranchus kaupii TaxID=118154 RepID=A0A9Q1FG91_SYNKA|nr:hypothetical protein SKAU_G00205290 [Synaphobranchus kaupii]